MTNSLLKNNSAHLQKSPILLGFRAVFFNFLLTTHLDNVVVSSILAGGELRE